MIHCRSAVRRTAMANEATRTKFAEIRREVENLLVSLDIIDKATTKGPADLARVLANESQTEEREHNSFAELFTAIRQLNDSDPASARSLDGAAVSIEDYWQRVEALWPRIENGNVPSAEAVSRDSADARGWLKKMNWEAAVITVPDDLGAWIEKQRVLRPLDFNKIFARDLPDPDERARMLEYLLSAPETYPDAFISAKTGKVYRTSARSRDVVLSYALFAGTIVLGAAVLAGLSLASIGGLTPALIPKVIWAYAGVVAGAFGHTVIDLWKARGTEGELFTELGPRGYFLWGHSQESQIWKALVALPVGPIIMLNLLQDMSPATGLFVGYSFDSILDLALKRFDKSLAAGSAAITEKLAAA